MQNRQQPESAKNCTKQNKTLFSGLLPDAVSEPNSIPENSSIIYTGTRNGIFIAADANTGKILRQYNAGNSSTNKITADKDGNIWISLIEGSLF